MNMDKRNLQILLDLVEAERDRNISGKWEDELYLLATILLQEWNSLVLIPKVDVDEFEIGDKEANKKWLDEHMWQSLGDKNDE